MYGRCVVAGCFLTAWRADRVAHRCRQKERCNWDITDGKRWGGGVISCQTGNERVIGGIHPTARFRGVVFFLLMWWPVDDDGSSAMETFLGKFVCDLYYMGLPRRMSSHATTTTTHTTTYTTPLAKTLACVGPCRLNSPCARGNLYAARENQQNHAMRVLSKVGTRHSWLSLVLRDTRMGEGTR
jgi:hypothetical protein